MTEETLPSVFDEVFDPFAVRRKYMVPKWIRFFAWIFAVLCPLVLVIGLISAAVDTGNYSSSIYGFSATSIISITGIIGSVAFALKGVAAIGLLAEKDWAVKVAIADGAIGILLCIVSFIVTPYLVSSGDAVHFNMRFEVLLLLPYLQKMINIRKEWEENKYTLQSQAHHPLAE